MGTVSDPATATLVVSTPTRGSGSGRVDAATL